MKHIWISHSLNENIILVKDDFFISFHPFVHSRGPAETALCYKETYYILDGDWRLEYEEVAHDINKCLELFYSLQKDFESKWSEAPLLNIIKGNKWKLKS